MAECENGACDVLFRGVDVEDGENDVAVSEEVCGVMWL